VKQKFAGLPVWAWVAIVAAGVLVGILILRRRQAANAQAATALTPDQLGQVSSGLAGADTSGNSAPADSLSSGTLQALVDQLGVVTQDLQTQQQAMQDAAFSAASDPFGGVGVDTSATSAYSTQTGPRAQTTWSIAPAAPVPSSALTRFASLWHRIQTQYPHYTVARMPGRLTPRRVQTHGPTAEPRMVPQSR
jgi:hypothetical protein